MRIFFSKYWIYISIAVLLLGAGWIWASRDAGTAQLEEAPQNGFMAPDFTLETFEGEEITLADLRGKAIMINFWASWCPPCRAEMPSMEKVYQEYQDQGFVVLAINATHQDAFSDAALFVETSGFSFPVLADTTGSVSQSYQLRSLPTSLFVDKEGVIQEIVYGGPIPEADIQARVESLLGGK